MEGFTEPAYRLPPSMMQLLPLLAAAAAAPSLNKAPPLQVIIIAGQSNTIGHGYAESSTLH